MSLQLVGNRRQGIQDFKKELLKEPKDSLIVPPIFLLFFHYSPPCLPNFTLFIHRDDLKVQYWVPQDRDLRSATAKGHISDLLIES